MNRKTTVLLASLFIVYIIYHLTTLAYSPIVWLDEVTFGSMTESWMKHRTLYEEARIIAEPQQKLNYGPIYFALQSMLMKAFGFGIFNFRLTNMLFGFIDLFLVYQVCRKLRLSMQAALVTVVFLALEPNYNQFLHSGRMDFITVFFFMLAFLALLSSEGDGRGRIAGFGALSGVLLACAFLTTPRIIFSFAVFVCYFIYELVVEKNKASVLVRYLSVGAGFAAIILWWMYATFGSIGNYIYTTTHASYLKDHMGIESGLSLRYNLLLYLFVVIGFAVLVATRKAKDNMRLILFSLPAIVAFIFIVTGSITGRYFALVATFVAVFIVAVTIDQYPKKIFRFATYATIVGFAVVFVFKAAYIYATIPQRDHEANAKIIMQHIPENVTVVGDFQYYYMVREHNCAYLSIDINGTAEEKWGYFLQHKIPYVILNKDCKLRTYYENVYLNEHYERMPLIEGPSYSNFFSRIIKKLPYHINDNYSCYIYKFKG